MQAIYNSDAFYYVLLAGFIIYGIYYLYGIIKYFRKSQAARKRFTEMHRREEIRAYNGYRIWIILFVIFVGYSLWSAFTIQDGSEQGPWFRLAFLLVAIVLAGQGILAVVKRRILFADDGFAYEDEAFRWQSVISMDPQKKGLIRGVDLLVTNGRHYMLPRDIGRALHEEHLNWKKRKKSSKADAGK